MKWSIFPRNFADAEALIPEHLNTSGVDSWSRTDYPCLPCLYRALHISYTLLPYNIRDLYGSIKNDQLFHLP